MKNYKIIGLTLLVVIGASNIAKSQMQNFLNFDGIDDYVQVENNPLNYFSNDFTIEMYFKRKRLNIREDIISKKDLNSSYPSSNDVALVISDDNQLLAYFRETLSNQVILTSITSIDTTDWVHVACVRSASTVSLYVNGNLEATGSIGNDLSSNGPLRIGSNRSEILDPNAPSEYQFEGNIDEVRLWNVGRSSIEIGNNLNIELIGNEPGLATYYNFNQGFPCSNNLAIDTLRDAIYNNVGVLINFDLTGTLTNPCQSNWNGSPLNSIQESRGDLVKIYPNPADDKIMIENDGAAKATFTIQAIDGRMVMEGEIDNNEIDISALKSGLYLLTLALDGEWYQHKLLKP